MIVSSLLVVGGVILLVFGAERAVHEAEHIADQLRISPIVVGALVVGLGTSLPEMVVSGIAAAQRDTIDLAAGNVIGSNAANLTLVLGVGALITTIRPNRQVFRREGILMLAATLLLALTLVDEHLSKTEAGLLLLAMVGAAITITQGTHSTEHEPHTKRTTTLTKPIIWAVASLAAVVLGAQILVLGATEIADRLGASEAFIGVTVVAIGTSLPELATTVAAARRRAVDLIVGNVFGSNIFNSLAVTGIAGIAGTGQLEDLPTNSLFVMVAITILALGAGALRNEYSKADGYLLLLAYPLIIFAG